MTRLEDAVRTALREEAATVAVTSVAPTRVRRRQLGRVVGLALATVVVLIGSMIVGVDSDRGGTDRTAELPEVATSASVVAVRPVGTDLGPVIRHGRPLVGTLVTWVDGVAFDHMPVHDETAAESLPCCTAEWSLTDDVGTAYTVVSGGNWGGGGFQMGTAELRPAPPTSATQLHLRARLGGVDLGTVAVPLDGTADRKEYMPPASSGLAPFAFRPIERTFRLGTTTTVTLAAVTLWANRVVLHARVNPPLMSDARTERWEFVGVTAEDHGQGAWSGWLGPTYDMQTPDRMHGQVVGLSPDGTWNENDLSKPVPTQLRLKFWPDCPRCGTSYGYVDLDLS